MDLFRKKDALQSVGHLRRRGKNQCMELLFFVGVGNFTGSLVGRVIPFILG